jgi:hypothetical protein
MEGATNAKNTFGVVALATVFLQGWSDLTNRQEAACELKVTEICSHAAEAQLHGAILPVNSASRPQEAQVVPYVVPIFQPDGTLATEVDCYANTDLHTYSIVHSAIAIPPTSQMELRFLRAEHFCTDAEATYVAHR